LAADIQQNGLQVPIVLDHTGKVLIDGRNRLEACSRANVSPRFEKLPEGADPVAVIVGMNVNRRHLSKGQKAVITAFLYPEPENGGRGKKAATNSKDSLGFSPMRVSQARTVLRHSRALAEEVLKGNVGLDEALQQVHTEEGKARSRQTQIDELRAKSHDLIDSFNDGRMKFDDAMAEYHRRIIEEQRIREGVAFAFDGLSKFPGYVTGLLQAIEAGAENPLDDKIVTLVHDSTALLEKAWQEKRNGKEK
jgi:hypothetical protein